MMRYLLLSVVLLSGLVLGVVPPIAQDLSRTSLLYHLPVLALDPGMHTAAIRSADTDHAAQFAVTGSDDKTVRVWRLGAEPELLNTIRVPVGPGNTGKVYSVAMSPDGETIAVGGWTGSPENTDAHTIFVFSRGGKLITRIASIPSRVYGLSFSRDGHHLAAGLSGGVGMRVYSRTNSWSESARDKNYGGKVYGLAFAADGRLATTCEDGHVRLYDNHLELITKRKMTLGSDPIDVAFHPDGKRVAVGFDDTPRVALLDGLSLNPIPSPDMTWVGNGDLAKISWSADGKLLYAGGTFKLLHAGGGRMPRWRSAVVIWADGGTGKARALFPGKFNSISSLKALPSGDILLASGDPHLAVLSGDGKLRWKKGSPSFDPRGQGATFSVSADGTVVEFGYEAGGQSRARFDVEKLKLIAKPPADNTLLIPRRTGLDIGDWENTFRPTIAGESLPLKKAERSLSLAIAPKGDRFVLGTEWYLRAFDAAGKLLWLRMPPSTVWAVNVTGNGRLVVAAYGDGTIRWHRMDDGRELLAFFPLRNKKDWVAWTLEGIYAATPGAQGILKWHINRGWDKAAKAIPVSEIPRTNRPKVLPLMLQEMDPIRALGLAELAEIREAVKVRTGSSIPPGTRLHFLSVGVGEYGEHARRLRLDYAAKDATDVASALSSTQASLYADVLPQVLTDKDATRRGFFQALGAMTQNMKLSSGRDVAVVMFSGHGAMIDGSYYLLPHDVDARTPDEITNTAIPISILRKRLAKLAQGGRVLVLLDACRSGAITVGGTSLAVDGGQLRAALAGLANVTVLTSSSSSKPSFEHKDWENGAFTEVFLQALSKDADTNGNSLINMTELTDYMTRHLPRITKGKGDQVPGMEVRFQTEIFVSGL